MIGAYEHAANQSRGPTGFQYSFLYWLTTLLLFFTSIPENKAKFQPERLKRLKSGKSAILYSLNLASFFVGQLTVALGHDIMFLLDRVGTVSDSWSQHNMLWP